MSCSSCKDIIDPELPWAEFDYLPQKRIKKESMVKLPHKPRGGWSVVVPIRGSTQTIVGTNAVDVAHQVKKLFKLNNYNIDERVMWFNLNVQWLQKTPAKYHVIPLEEYLTYAEAQEIESSDKHALKKVEPSSWVGSFLDFVKVYADSETYSWETFLVFLNQFHRMLNPAENTLLGNAAWYLRFTISLDKIKKNPAYKGEQARNWLNGIQI